MADASLIDSLANSPLVQAAVLISTVLGTVIAVWRGQKQNSESPAAPPAATPGGVYPADARYFFDGPLTRALEFMQGTYRNSAEIRTEMQRNADGVRADLGEIIDLLREQNRNGLPVHRRRNQRRS